ncbi:MAG: low-complexity tail membrane protein [Synechococcales cyanobacterium C42_A2020_086]|nr:low-complexity tail membrane protein [Synechococcales cyanobacterium C42_A2020_086]
MRSFWSDPYLWVHLAGLAVVPIFLELCLLGLAATSSVLPAWLVLGLVGAAGSLPILWMQWQRPFNIFSVLILALKPSELSETQRRILSRFQTPLAKGVAVAAAGLLLAVLWQLYPLAPLVTSVARLPGGWLGGLLLAMAAFLGSNLFVQVPLSVLQVLLLSDSALAATPAYPVEQIEAHFTTPGFRVKHILPMLQVGDFSAIPSTQMPETDMVAELGAEVTDVVPGASPTATPEVTLNGISAGVVEALPDAGEPIEDREDGEDGEGIASGESVASAESSHLPEAGDSQTSDSEIVAPSSMEPSDSSSLVNPFPAVSQEAAFEDASDEMILEAEIINSQEQVTASQPVSDSLPAESKNVDGVEVAEVVEVTIAPEEAEAAGVEETAAQSATDAVEAAGEAESDDEFFEASPAPSDPTSADGSNELPDE